MNCSIVDRRQITPPVLSSELADCIILAHVWGHLGFGIQGSKSMVKISKPGIQIL